MVKAILECQSFELLMNLAALTSAGISIDQVTAVGGGARSPAWLQVKSDVLAIAIRTLRVKEAACLGAALFAGAGAGIYSSIADGARRTVKFEAQYQPDPAAHEAYARRFAIYRDLHATLRPIHARLRS